MKKRTKKKCAPAHRVSFATIKAAKEFDPEATMKILDFYRGYMLELCRLRMRFAEHNFVGKVWAGVYLDTLGAVYDVIWPKRESSGRTKPAMAAPSRACWSAISASD